MMIPPFITREDEEGRERITSSRREQMKECEGSSLIQAGANKLERVSELRRAYKATNTKQTTISERNGKFTELIKQEDG